MIMLRAILVSSSESPDRLYSSPGYFCCRAGSHSPIMSPTTREGSSRRLSTSAVTSAARWKLMWVTLSRPCCTRTSATVLRGTASPAGVRTNMFSRVAVLSRSSRG